MQTRRKNLMLCCVSSVLRYQQNFYKFVSGLEIQRGAYFMAASGKEERSYAVISGSCSE